MPQSSPRSNEILLLICVHYSKRRSYFNTLLTGEDPTDGLPEAHIEEVIDKDLDPPDDSGPDKPPPDKGKGRTEGEHPNHNLLTQLDLDQTFYYTPALVLDEKPPFALKTNTSMPITNIFALGLSHNQSWYNLNHGSNSPCDLLLYHAIPWS